MVEMRSITLQTQAIQTLALQYLPSQINEQAVHVTVHFNQRMQKNVENDYSEAISYDRALYTFMCRRYSTSSLDKQSYSQLDFSLNTKK